MSQTINLTQAAIQPEDVKKAKETPVRDFLRSQVAFFYLVLLIFIVVSVTESGDFFNKAITHDVFNGILGYAVATVFDLFSLVCMIARMNASRIADKRGMFLSLVGVIVCAGASAFANVASAVQDYQVSQFSNIPTWMQQVSPYLGMVFPGMVIVVTLIADHIGDLNPQKADSVANYRLKEQKKIDLLRVRFEIEKERAALQKDIALLHQKPSKREQKNYAKLLEEANQKHMQIVNNLQASFANQMLDLQTQIQQLSDLLFAKQFVNDQQTNEQTKPEEKTNQFANDDPNTEEIEQVNKPTPKSNMIPFANRGTKSNLGKVRKLVRSNADIKPTEIAKRLQISVAYASQLRTKVLKEA